MKQVHKKSAINFQDIIVFQRESQKNVFKMVHFGISVLINLWSFYALFSMNFILTLGSVSQHMNKKMILYLLKLIFTNICRRFNKIS